MAGRPAPRFDPPQPVRRPRSARASGLQSALGAELFTFKGSGRGVGEPSSPQDTRCSAQDWWLSGVSNRVTWWPLRRPPPVLRTSGGHFSAAGHRLPGRGEGACT